MQPNYADLIELARTAGKAILDIYQRSEYTVVKKSDTSPLTEADLAANEILVHGIQAISTAPIISEESPVPDQETRKEWNRFWLIDPLDGTKEFINRTDEFSINIALIEDGKPIFGLIYAPVTDECFYGGEGRAYVKTGDNPPQPLKPTVILKRLSQDSSLRVLGSKRHGAEQVALLCERLEERLAPVQHVSVGSALKLAYLAAGRGELYPRFGSVSEWDIAAGHALLNAVGGELVSTQFEPIRYGLKPNLIVAGFFSFADSDFDWRPLLLT